MGESLVQRLALEGYDVRWWKTGAAAVEGRGSAARISWSATSVCPTCPARRSSAPAWPDRSAPPFLFITGYGDIDEAVRLMRAGAGDYLTKPFEMPVARPYRPAAAAAAGESAGRSLLACRSHAPDRADAAAGRRDRRTVAPHRRDRRRQGGGGALPARVSRRAERPSWRSTAPRSRATCSRASCSATSAAPSPARTRHEATPSGPRRHAVSRRDRRACRRRLQAKLLRLLEERAVLRVGGEQPWRSAPGWSARPTPT